MTEGTSSGQICGQDGQAEGTASRKPSGRHELLVVRDKTKPLPGARGAQMKVVGFEDGEEGKGQIVQDLVVHW